MAARYISIEINKRECKVANQFFNSIFFACLIMGCCFIAFFFALSLSIDSVMSIEPVMVSQVQVLLMAMAGTLFCTMFKTPFTAALYANNRLYVDSLFLGISQLARVVAPLALFGILGPSIWLPYMASLMIDVAACLFYVRRYRKYNPNLSLGLEFARWALFVEVLSSGVWVSVQKAGAVLISTISLYLANIMIGEYEAGIFNTITQLQSFASVYAVAMVNLFVPYIYSAYAHNDRSIGLVLKRSFHVAGLLLGPVLGGVIAFAVAFLTYWTQMDMSVYALCITIMLGYPALTYVCELLSQVFIAEKAVKIPALATIGFGVMNIALSALFCVVFDLGVVGLAAAQAFSLLARHYFITVPYASKLLHMRIARLLGMSFFSPLVSCFSLVVGVAVETAFPPVGLPVLLLEGFFSVGVGVAFGLALLPGDTRAIVIDKIKNKL